jgi:hypothetical protein
MSTVTHGKIESRQIMRQAQLVTNRLDSGEKWYTGFVGTPYGFVQLYAEAKIWEARFIWQGKEFFRCDLSDGLITPRSLAMKGRAFAKQVVEGGDPCGISKGARNA